MVVGGKRQRTETGEVCVAIETDAGPPLVVLQPHGGPALPLSDESVGAELAKIETSLAAHDDSSRRTAAATHDSIWEDRHAVAREWARRNPSPAIPPFGAHPVEAFISKKIQHAPEVAPPEGTAPAGKFPQTVLPILEEHCFRCHGEK